MVHDGAHIQRSGNGCRREMALSRENAFQLDSWDNAFRHEVSRVFASHQQNHMGAANGGRLGVASERLFWMG
jgi:hypothetical protein